MGSFQAFWQWLSRTFAAKPAPPPAAPADPRLETDPWLGALFAQLGNRYQLGPDTPEGARVLRRTGRARFNDMPVWLRAAERTVRASYEVRAHGDRKAATAQARAILDERATAPLAARGLLPGADSIEDWGGTVVQRSYQGRCEDPSAAAAAVRYVCEESEPQVDTAAE